MNEEREREREEYFEEQAYNHYAEEAQLEEDKRVLKELEELEKQTKIDKEG